MKRPLLRFALLGVALFALSRMLGPPLREAPPFAPGAAVSDDALLLHEALARGYAETDTVVRRRLAMNLRFAEGARGRDDAALVRDALALGMHASDVVVQRRLVQKMRLTLAAESRGAEPSETELAAYLAGHRARWTEPARVRATQLYFATRARAEAVGPRLPPDPARALALGEALPISAELPALSEDELARALGPRLAAAVFALAPRAWSAPLASTFGWHRVFVRERVPERATPLATVRGEVRAALLAERDAASVRATLAAWRARWRLAPEPAL